MISKMGSFRYIIKYKSIKSRTKVSEKDRYIQNIYLFRTHVNSISYKNRRSRGISIKDKYLLDSRADRKNIFITSRSHSTYHRTIQSKIARPYMENN